MTTLALVPIKEPLISETQPYQHDDGKWYFNDHVYRCSPALGGYDTYEEALREMNAYVEETYREAECLWESKDH